MTRSARGAQRTPGSLAPRIKAANAGKMANAGVIREPQRLGGMIASGALRQIEPARSTAVGSSPRCDTAEPWRWAMEH